MDETEEQRIRQIVDDALRKVGLDPDKPEESREVIRWTAEHMQSFKNIGGWAAKSVVLAVVAVLLLATWEGMKLFIRSIAE